ncbi:MULTISPECIES: potassium channel family protein [Caproicibacterium]|uniref:Trk system potassium uptake protein TrkA n=1 Tax=Caproicibacterium argilliputei TaxID=3030016 RepID=A0AA97DB95_9FIRM|nr:TrkA family potassium uptake protein [Caproicibacterium argilliputei]WOC32632.1 TrkA family potassium uptake protein [Caproicibacterium argilliputei]
MNVVILGGGKLGRQLARNMLDRKNTVHLIEKDKLRCMHLANELDIEIICGDGTEIEVLRRAQTEHADCFLAVGGSDQDNLVACQLAKKEFGAQKVIARANDPRNLPVLRTLGTELVVSSTEIITNLIEQEVDMAEMHMLATLNKGRAAISAVTLPDNTELEGVALKDLSLPAGSLLISVVRGETMMVPNGDTMFQPGDEIVAVCEGASQRKLQALLTATRG